MPCCKRDPIVTQNTVRSRKISRRSHQIRKVSLAAVHIFQGLRSKANLFGRKWLLFRPNRSKNDRPTIFNFPYQVALDLMKPLLLENKGAFDVARRRVPPPHVRANAHIRAVRQNRGVASPYTTTGTRLSPCTGITRSRRPPRRPPGASHRNGYRSLASCTFGTSATAGETTFAKLGRLRRSSATGMQWMKLIRSDSARDKRVPNGDLANLLAMVPGADARAIAAHDRGGGRA